MTELSTSGVVGIDGSVPVYDPTARWCIWSIHEVYIGTVGLNRYVPKLKDYVIDPDTYTMWIVVHIDPVTLIARLQEIRPANMTFSVSETDVLFGVGPGTQSDTYRIYLDTTVMPHVLAVDARLKIGGSMASYVKLFKGADVSAMGTVISRMYDAGGNVLTDQVPLETVAIDSHVVYAIKIVSVCYTNHALVDGEIVTAVIYDTEGHVVSKRQLLVENTGFIRGVNAAQTYVSHISLESPFLSPTLDHVIEFPLNMPLNALNLTGVVHYSDGSTLKLPVNGSRFTLFGLDQFVSTIIGQKIELVLNYALFSNETTYGVPATENRCITEPYSLVVNEPNNSLAVKLFGYPTWVNAANGYRLNWYLLNLDRTVFFDVTGLVTFADNTGAFDPKGYGYLQRKAVTLNLQDVSSSFRPFIHTQLVDIILKCPPDGRKTPWTVSHEAIGSRPPYGEGLWAIRHPTQLTVDLRCGCTTQNEWLAKLYLQTYPLIDRLGEVVPPTPTHFELRYGNAVSEYSIAEWDALLTTSAHLAINSLLVIRFVKRVGVTSMNLAIAALLVVE